jgi:hypothetical protein
MGGRARQEQVPKAMTKAERRELFRKLATEKLASEGYGSLSEYLESIRPGHLKEGR